VQALGITGALYRTLRTTNPIENLNGSVARYSRNVKRWGDGQMVLRWVASALSDAAHANAQAAWLQPDAQPAQGPGRSVAPKATTAPS
jgi:hypothetical protein